MSTKEKKNPSQKAPVLIWEPNQIVVSLRVSKGIFKFSLFIYLLMWLPEHNCPMNIKYFHKARIFAWNMTHFGQIKITKEHTWEQLKSYYWRCRIIWSHPDSSMSLVKADGLRTNPENSAQHKAGVPTVQLFLRCRCHNANHSDSLKQAKWVGHAAHIENNSRVSSWASGSLIWRVHLSFSGRFLIFVSIIGLLLRFNIWIWFNN